MTTTEAPPPPVPEDIPGVTRRHRWSDFYHERTNFQFIKHSKRWAIVSGTLVVVCLLLLAVRGLNFGIEFEGGTEWKAEVAADKEAKVAQIRDVVGPLGFEDAKVSILTSSTGPSTVRVQAEVVEDPIRKLSKSLSTYAKVTENEVQFVPDGDGGSFTFTAGKDVKPTKDAVEKILKKGGVTGATVTVKGQDVTIIVKKLPASGVQKVAAALAKYTGSNVRDVSITTVGPTWGSEVSEKALRALIIFFLLLAAYLTIRFEWKMAASSIVAVLHDIIFTVGVYALFQFPVTPATVTAFLTILGFSLYDTVVVFDKVGELEKTLVSTGRASYGDMVNRALNAVLWRSLSTSVIALLPVLSLLFIGSLALGANALLDFALALAAGLFIGSYSSIFVAAPLLAWWKEREPRYRALKERKRRTTLAAASAATGAAVVVADDYSGDPEKAPLGVPGPPAVPRSTIQARPRQQRGRKRK